MAIAKDSTIYIAGPMSGLPDFNYPAFREAERRLRAAGYTSILNPVDNEALRTDDATWAPWSWYMRQSLRQLADTDAIALLDGWEASRGASLEVELGTKLEMTIAPLEDYLTN